MKPRSAVLVMCAVCLLVGADSDLVRRHVKNGIRNFQRAEYNAAAKAFQDADLLEPGNPIIEFNRGCAEARVQNREGARSLFRSVTLAEDPALAASAHYNLGCLEVIEARGIFGESPEDASKEIRTRGVRTLTTAIRHFRDALAIQPDHDAAKKNIEVLKLWLADMRRKWNARDAAEEKNQNQQPLSEPLPWLLDRLDLKQHAAHELVVRYDSRRPTIESIREPQQKVLDRIPELREKIREYFAPAEGADAPDPAAEAAIQEMLEGADVVEKHLREAIDSLNSDNPTDALDPQVAAIDKLNEMFESVVGFPQLVNRALRVQRRTEMHTQLYVNVQPRSQRSSPDTPTANPTMSGRPQGSGEPVPFDPPPPPPHYGNLLYDRQSRVRSMANLIPERATELKELLDQQQQAGAEQNQSIQGFRTAIDRALQYSPRIQLLTDEAVRLLAVGRQADAIPRQAEAADLLARIAETLPRDRNGGQGDPDDEEQTAQDQSNKQSGQVGEDDVGENNPTETEEEKSEKEQQQHRREQAETLLRRVRDREQNLKDLKAQLRAMRARRSTAERDW